MQIIIDPSVGRQIIIEHNGKRHMWKYSVWSKLKDQSTDDIFGATNEYLASLPAGVQDRMYANYATANECCKEAYSEREIRKMLFQYAQLIVSEISEAGLYEWAKVHGGIYVAPTPPVRKSTNPPAMKYTEEESYELSVFCVAVKILAPILGLYVDCVTSTVTNTLKETRANELFYETQLVKWKAFARLNRYTDALAMRKQNVVSMAILHNLPSADLNCYLMGHAVIRRLTIAKVRSDDDGSIVAFIYKFLEEKIIELTKSDYRDKMETAGGDDSESESYSDKFRVPEDVDRGTVATADEDLQDIDRMMEFHRFDGEQTQRCVRYYMELAAEQDFVPTNVIHYFVCGMVMRYHTYHQIVDKISYDSLLRITAVAAVYCEIRGWDEISELVRAVRKEKDPTKVVASVQNGKTFAPLRRQDADLLKAAYPHIPEGNRGNTNPGKEIIEEIVKIIMAFDWVGMEEPLTIRKNLCDFIVNREIREIQEQN